MSAPPSERIEETDGDVTYIRTDAQYPPVAIVDRSDDALAVARAAANALCRPPADSERTDP